jgi:hypothetical protein
METKIGQNLLLLWLFEGCGDPRRKNIKRVGSGGLQLLHQVLAVRLLFVAFADKQEVAVRRFANSLAGVRQFSFNGFHRRHRLLNHPHWYELGSSSGLAATERDVIGFTERL